MPPLTEEALSNLVIIRRMIDSCNNLHAHLNNHETGINHSEQENLIKALKTYEERFLALYLESVEPEDPTVEETIRAEAV